MYCSIKTRAKHPITRKAWALSIIPLVSCEQLGKEEIIQEWAEECAVRASLASSDEMGNTLLLYPQLHVCTPSWREKKYGSRLGSHLRTTDDNLLFLKKGRSTGCLMMLGTPCRCRGNARSAPRRLGHSCIGAALAVTLLGTRKRMLHWNHFGYPQGCPYIVEIRNRETWRITTAQSANARPAILPLAVGIRATGF